MSNRAVLVTPRLGNLGVEKSAMRQAAAALERMTELGYQVVCVFDSADYREAHRMIADDLADVIVVFRLPMLPSVQIVGDVASRPARQRAAPVLRPVAGHTAIGERQAIPEARPQRDMRQVASEPTTAPTAKRRPQLVRRDMKEAG